RAFLVGHVPSQRPPPSDRRVTAGSPFEKVAVTEPVSSGAPQSSRTFAPRATGQPADTANDWPKVVSAGTSLVGVQEDAVRRAREALLVSALLLAGAGVTTTRTST